MLALHTALTSHTRRPRLKGMTLTEAPTLFQTLSVLIFLGGLALCPLFLKTLARAARSGVEDALTPPHKHGKIRA